MLHHHARRFLQTGKLRHLTVCVDYLAFMRQPDDRILRFAARMLDALERREARLYDGAARAAPLN
jgi:hypothetical protein